jgi:hypothetical protein
MSFVCPLPPLKVMVRPEFLYDFQCDKDAPLVGGIWVSVKAIRGEAFRFETYLPEYGALYDKLPISAFLWRSTDYMLGCQPLPLDVLQIWDAMSYHVEVVEKPLLKGLRCEFFGKDKQTHHGVYQFTLDTCNPDPRIPDFTFSETVDEHKGYNVITLDNGQIALQPNNRCRFYDPAFNPKDMKFPDFKVATRKYRVEQYAKWRLGDTSTVTYDDRGEEV